MGKSNIIDWSTLGNFMKDVFMKVGVPEEDAEICADVLMESDRRGIESHGGTFKPIYIDRIKLGIKIYTSFEIIKDPTIMMTVMTAWDCHWQKVRKWR